MSGVGATGVNRAVGARIRWLRERAGLSQEQIATRVAKTQTTISAWEAGRRTPGLAELVSLAEVLGVEVGEFFVQTRSEAAPRVLLRAEASRMLRDELVVDVERFADAVAAVKPPGPLLEINDRHPESAAQEVLGRCGIAQPPIKMGAVTKACGVRVLGWDFDEAVSGLLVDLDSGPAIGFNRNHARNRRRFSVAHELGHLLLRHHEHFHVDLTDAPSQIGEPPGYDWKDEREANRFAAELLMPAHLVEKAYSEQSDVQTLARLFVVSTQAMGFRVGNLDLA